MKRTLSILAAAAVASASFAGSTNPVWYGGDPDIAGGANYFSSVGSTTWPNNIAYDDFVWNSANPASCVWGTWISDAQTIPNLYVEIRSGMSPGNGGTLVFSGTFAAVSSNLGVSPVFGAPFSSHYVEANIGSVNLTNGGTYWLGLGADVTGPFVGAAYRTVTGANSVGSPILNNGVLLNGNTFVFADPNPGTPSGDMSYGIGTAVPEPATMAALGLGLAAVARRRKRK